jgi:hypothetical protein
VIVPEAEYVFAVAANAETVAFAPLTVTDALVGLKLYPATLGVIV